MKTKRSLCPQTGSGKEGSGGSCSISNPRSFNESRTDRGVLISQTQIIFHKINRKTATGGCFSLIELGVFSLFHSAETTSTHRNGLNCSVNANLYLTDIRLPSSVGLAVRVRNLMTEDNALAAYTAFCHYKHLLRTIKPNYIQHPILYHKTLKNARVFEIFF